MYFIGFDLGGTKIEAMLLHFGPLQFKNRPLLTFEFQKANEEIVQGFVLYKKRVPTERHLGYEQIIDKMAKLAHEVCEDVCFSLDKVAGIGVSVPGPIDPRTGLVSVSNSMVVVGHSVHADLQEKLRLSCPFISANDANCFALAEAVCGAGLQFYKQTNIPIRQQTAVGLILGSGFGGGLVVHGKMLTGRRGGAGEVGHVTIYPDGHPCYCGRRGCAEQYLSGPALEASLNSRIYSQIPKRPSAAEIFELYEKQDPIALAVVKQYKKDLAFYLGNLTNLFDPHYFVLGGGISLQNLIYQGLSEKVGENTFLPAEAISVFKHSLGDSAGAIGAALVVMEKYGLN